VVGGVVLEVQDAHLPGASVLAELDVHDHGEAPVQVLEAEVAEVVVVGLWGGVGVHMHAVQAVGQLRHRGHVPGQRTTQRGSTATFRTVIF